MSDKMPDETPVMLVEPVTGRRVTVRACDASALTGAKGRYAGWERIDAVMAATAPKVEAKAPAPKLGNPEE